MPGGPTVAPLARALSLLTAYTPCDRWLTNAELAARTGLPAPTVTRISRALTALGYLIQVPAERGYRLAAPVLALGYAAIGQSDVHRVARERMSAFAQEHQLLVNLSSRDRLDVLVVESCSAAPAPHPASLQVGSRLGLAASPIGWALLAGLPERERYYLLEGVERRAACDWPRLRRRCSEAMAQVYERGWCSSVGDWDPKLAVVGVPVSIEGRGTLVLGCVGTTAQLPRQRIERELAPRLLALARDIREAAKPAGQAGDAGLAIDSPGASAFMPRTSQRAAAVEPLPRVVASDVGARQGAEPASDPGLVTAARGLQVLRAFRSARAPLSNAELVRRTGLSKAVVSRFTSTLMQLGHLEHAGGRREFQLGSAAFGIGHAFLAASEILQRAQPAIQRLAQRLDASAALAIGHGLDMLYVAYRTGPHVSTLRLDVGSMLPMGGSAIGHAWLWAQEDALKARLIEQLAERAGADAQALRDGIARSVADLDRSGTCTVMHLMRGTYGVALPLRVGRERTLLSLSCGKALLQAHSDADSDAERRRVVPLLKEAAAELQAALADADGLP